MARASARPRHRAPVRGYGVTPWGAAFLRAFSPADPRRVTKARSYFRDRHVHDLAVGPGRVTSFVTGSQLDPFAVTIDLRTADAATVVGLLRGAGRTADLSAAARGQQPAGLLEFIAPTDSGDATVGCTCPVEGLCIHVLATAFEVAAMIDRDPTVALTVLGVPLADLLAAANDAADGGVDTPPRPAAHRPSTAIGTPSPDGVIPDDFYGDDFYGDAAVLPPPPTLVDFHAFTEFDPPLLRRALRATGIAALDVAEAVDELAGLYDRITDRG